MKVGTNASCIIMFGYFKDSMNDIYLYIYIWIDNLGLIQFFPPSTRF